MSIVTRLALRAEGHRAGLGDTLGHTEQAIETDRKAIAVAEPLVNEHPDNADARRALASANEQLGSALAVGGQYAVAFSRLGDAAKAFDRVAASRPGDFQALADAGGAWQTFGATLSEKGGYISFSADKPLAYLRKSTDYFQRALRIHPDDPSVVKLLAAARESVGRIDSLPDPRRGAGDYADALSLLARLPAGERQSVDVRQLHARIKVNIGRDQGQLGQFKDALANIAEGRATRWRRPIRIIRAARGGEWTRTGPTVWWRAMPGFPPNCWRAFGPPWASSIRW